MQMQIVLIQYYLSINPNQCELWVMKPLPPIEVQQAIVNIYKCANEAKRIAEEADRLSREVCPALLQHVIHS